MEIICCGRVLHPRKGQPLVCQKCGTKYGVARSKPKPSHKKKPVMIQKTMREVFRDAKWIVIDRSWGTIWGVPGPDDLSQVGNARRLGRPTPDELRVRRYILRDPRFKLRYARWSLNQLVFSRVQ